ncbi:MAG TPA: universal stress protein [Solirubrobacteraceae bacterium]|nr:universal stress protein [Solirubrobacteraceae bacterium]
MDGTASGRDSVALGSLLARPTSAELTLIAVREEPLLAVSLPAEANWATSERQARTMLAQTRDAMAPHARTVVESDVLIWRALRRAVRRDHRDLLVVGSARDADDGRVRLGRSARELVDHLECPLAVAPSGMADRENPRLDRIGVGFDGGPASRAALGLATSIASAAGAELEVWGAVEDSLERELAPASGNGGPTEVHVRVGMPTDVLCELGSRVDLLVIGSGHSGRSGRVQLGGTGRALLHYAPCPMLVVPRPPD